MAKMKVWIPILTSISLYGCSAQWHLNQALKKDPTIIDTGAVYILDTIHIREEVSKVDTFITTKYDTLVVYDSINKIETQIIRISDTLLVTTKVLPDTIRITKQMRSKPRKTIYKQVPLYKNLFFWLFSVLLILLWLTRRSTK